MRDSKHMMLAACCRYSNSSARSVSGFIWIYFVLFTFLCSFWMPLYAHAYKQNVLAAVGAALWMVMSCAASASEEAHFVYYVLSMYVCMYACTFTHGWMRAERDVAPLCCRCYCAAGALFYAASSKLKKCHCSCWPHLTMLLLRCCFCCCCCRCLRLDKKASIYTRIYMYLHMSVCVCIYYVLPLFIECHFEISPLAELARLDFNYSDVCRARLIIVNKAGKNWCQKCP